MSSNEGPYKVDRMGVVRGPGGEDYRLGDEDQAGVLCAAMNDAFRAGQRAANEGLVRAAEAAEHRYRSMWFGLSDPKPISDTREEWVALKDALAAVKEGTTAADARIGSSRKD